MPSASSAIDALRDLADLMETAQGENEQLQICHPGRPRIEISENQLHFLVENNFRVKDIASMFSCSTRIIEWHLQDLHIQLSDYTAISDDDLDELVKRITLLHPRCGKKTVLGDYLEVRDTKYREKELGNHYIE